MPKGRVDYIDERLAELHEAEKRVMGRLGRSAQATRAEIVRLVSIEPAKRFYISQSEACRIIGFFEKGEKPPRSGLSYVMCEELYRSYVRTRNNNPGIAKSEIVEMTIHSEASSFFLAESTIEVMLRKR